MTAGVDQDRASIFETLTGYVRGGIYTTVVAEHRKAGWEPAAKIELTSQDEQARR